MVWVQGTPLGRALENPCTTKSVQQSLMSAGSLVFLQVGETLESLLQQPLWILLAALRRGSDNPAPIGPLRIHPGLNPPPQVQGLVPEWAATPAELLGGNLDQVAAKDLVSVS